MATIATLEARYVANITQFDAQLRRMQQLNAAAGRRIAQQNQNTVNQVGNQWRSANLGGAISASLGNGLGQLKSQLMGSIAAIVSGAGVAAAVGLADTYNRFTNSLKVAGVEGAALAVVQGQLFEAANRNGIAVESLGQLYGRVAGASKELGATQSQLLQVTDAVAAAIRISGQPMSSASGAMMQMAQALGGGTVRAEEFNSMMEGMLPLVQAAAAASTKYGGSVAKMRQDVIAGKLSSKEFFDLILAGSATLEAQAARAPLTVAQSFEVLKNKMIEAMGATNETWGITDRLTEALTWLSENIDTVAQALGTIAVVLAATMAPALGKATIGMTALTMATLRNGAASLASIPGVIGLTAGLNGITPAAAAARVALTALMSATGIGLAIVAVGAALTYFAAESYKASEATRDLRARVEEKKAAFEAADKAANSARQQTGQLTSAELAGATAAAAMTGEAHKLANAYYRIAAAAKAAAYEENARNLLRAEADVIRAQGDIRTQARNLGAARALGPVGAPLVNRYATGLGEASAAARDAALVRDRYAAQRGEIRNRRLDEYAPAPVTGGGGPARTGGGRSGPSAADIARNETDALAQANRQLADALRAQADTAAERSAATLAALVEDRDAAQLAVQRRVDEGQIGEATAEKLVTLQNEIYSAKVATETARRAEELRQVELELAQHRNDNASEALRLDADELTELARGTADMETRHAYERDALAKSQAADRLMFDAEQEAYRLQLELNGHAQAEIDRLIAEREANFARGQSGARTSQGNAQDAERGPDNIREWVSEFTSATAAGETFNQKLMGIAEGGINSITDGLTDAIIGAKSFGEAFKDMAKGIIAQLIKLAIQFVVFEMIGRAFGMPGLGRIAIGMQASASSAAKGGAGSGIKANAMGTRFYSGGPTSINEKGDEIITLPTGSQVIPANVVQRAMQVRPQARGAATYNLTTVVNAQNAVMREDIRNEIAQAHIMAVQRAKTETIGALATQQRNKLR